MKVVWITCPKCDQRFYAEKLMLADADPETGQVPYFFCPFCEYTFKKGEAKHIED